MTNAQLYIAIGIPIVFNTAALGLVVVIFMGYINTRFDSINHRFDAIDKRFDDMRDLWRAELNRVEGVFDARLKHLEEHIR